MVPALVIAFLIVAIILFAVSVLAPHPSLLPIGLACFAAGMLAHVLGR